MNLHYQYMELTKRMVADKQASIKYSWRISEVEAFNIFVLLRFARL